MLRRQPRQFPEFGQSGCRRKVEIKSRKLLEKLLGAFRRDPLPPDADRDGIHEFPGPEGRHMQGVPPGSSPEQLFGSGGCFVLTAPWHTGRNIENRSFLPAGRASRLFVTPGGSPLLLALGPLSLLQEVPGFVISEAPERCRALRRRTGTAGCKLGLDDAFVFGGEGDGHDESPLNSECYKGRYHTRSSTDFATGLLSEEQGLSLFKDTPGNHPRRIGRILDLRREPELAHTPRAGAPSHR